MSACANPTDAPLPPLDQAERDLRTRLQAHVVMLGLTIGERNAWKPEGAERAAHYIETSFAGIGLDPRRLPYTAPRSAVGGPFGFVGALAERLPAEQTHVNLEADIAGGAKANEIVVVGAHYDSLHGTKGANDNATGVAAVLEIARDLRDSRPARTIRFVAFANEEPPFFKSEAMGSRVYARDARARGDNIVAMFSLETIGYYSNAPGSQRAPFPLGLFYPTAGNFVIFVGNFSSRALVNRSVAAFRRATPFPAERFYGPAFIPGVDWSDQWSFWREGYPGVMVTDTAPYRYPHYHLESDTPDKIDYDSFARVVAGLVDVVRAAAND
ncbi:MAG: M20/M25/M40 family metallo-hydrolase [Alphaproteobacteria bacterium]|nr:M20/M25/M40 family metallo-hydrolase [Alphaproteobacteria bacterium]